MVNYLEVDTVKKIGKKVLAIPIDKQPSRIAGNILVAIMNNGSYEIAPDVTDENEYNEFVNLYKSGWYLSFTLYLVPKTMEKQDDIPKTIEKQDDIPMCKGIVCDNSCVGNDLWLK